MFAQAYAFGGSEDALKGYQRSLSSLEYVKKYIFTRIEQKVASYKKDEVPLPQKRAYEQMRYNHVYHTNAIEGNTISLYDTTLIMDTQRISGTFSVMEVLEVISTSEAVDYVDGLSRSSSPADMDNIEEIIKSIQVGLS